MTKFLMLSTALFFSMEKKIRKKQKKIHDHDFKRGACKNFGYVLPRLSFWQNGAQARKFREFCIKIGG
jgi:hypothetical protein